MDPLQQLMAGTPQPYQRGDLLKSMPSVQPTGVLETLKNMFVPQRDDQGIPQAPGAGDFLSAAMMAIPGASMGRGASPVFAAEKGAGTGGGRPPTLGNSRPEHIDLAATSYDGKVYTGQLHSDAVGKLIKEMGMTEQQFDREYKNMVQGYVTNTGRFLERDEAAKLTGGTKPIHGDATYLVKAKPAVGGGS